MQTRNIWDTWKRADIHGKIRIAAFLTGWLLAAYYTMVPFSFFQKIRLNIVDPPAVKNLIKEPVQQRKVQCPIQGMLLTPDEELVLVFNNTPIGRDIRYGSGLVLVMESGIPQYTLGFSAGSEFGVFFDREGWLCIERKKAQTIAKYSLDGIYNESEKGDWREYIYEDSLITSDGIRYELYREPNQQWLVMTDTVETRHLIYEVRPEVFAKMKVQTALAVGLCLVALFEKQLYRLLLFLREAIHELLYESIWLLQDERNHCREEKVHIAEEKKSNKSIWR